jgi:hypothetical protein
MNAQLTTDGWAVKGFVVGRIDSGNGLSRESAGEHTHLMTASIAEQAAFCAFGGARVPRALFSQAH